MMEKMRDDNSIFSSLIISLNEKINNLTSENNSLLEQNKYVLF